MVVQDLEMWLDDENLYHRYPKSITKLLFLILELKSISDKFKMLYTAILGFLPNLLIIQNASFNYMLYILYMSRLPIWIQCHVLLKQSPLSFQ